MTSLPYAASALCISARALSWEPFKIASGVLLELPTSSSGVPPRLAASFIVAVSIAPQGWP